MHHWVREMDECGPPARSSANVGGLILVVPHSPDPIVLQLQPGMIRSGVACTPSPSGLADLGCEAMMVTEKLGELVLAPTRDYTALAANLGSSTPGN